MFEFENDFVLLYYNAATFKRDFESGALYADLSLVKRFYHTRPDTKIILLLHSVSDTLYNLHAFTRFQ